MESPWADPTTYWPRLTEATRAYGTPLATLDRAALDANAADLVRRAAGTPIRVASKSVRVRSVLEDVLARPGLAGVLAYALAMENLGDIDQQSLADPQRVFANPYLGRVLGR